ncbi:MAG: molybdopterin-binding protein [Pseudomonadota bacterium]
MKNKTINKSVAILLTGDELVNGEIIDNNGHQIARYLFDHAIANGMRLNCSDDQEALELSMRFLLRHHQALITTGGLGPTSDDRTRFALANITGQTLRFDEESWQRITERLHKVRVSPIGTNKQQALFPESARVIPNFQGTASACELRYQDKLIFMLPGPPAECMPIFESEVLPRLIEEGFCCDLYREKWQLTGIGEGNIAAQLDPLLEQYDFILGYRAHKPYIDLKITCDDAQVFKAVKAKIEALIKPYKVN